ncbi:endonuclease/exonuclease/phosphatase family protein [Kitasatospora sp. NPDC058406]|uniref:endonuclease/exonuclease/phosphatase family protein n=1 Tax=Kitasatospora sp. NPDC058406 TaxID=3346483 RepID=UPI00365A0E64
MKVLTHNVMFLSWLMQQSEGDFDNAARSQLIAESAYVADHDLLVFQELFDPDPSEELLKRLEGRGYSHRTPVVGVSEEGWDATHGKEISRLHVRGGVAIVSRWPILRREQYIYDMACGWDAEADKGFAYVLLEVDGRRVHVVGTHLQSDDSGCSAGQAKVSRRSQMHEINVFLTDRRIPADEPVIVAGDFNTDRRSPDFEDILSFGNLQDPGPRTGWKYSFDTTANGVALHRYPADPSEDMDCVLLRKGHVLPCEGWVSEVLKVASPRWEAGGRTYTDFSDHYPVTAGC